MIINCMNIEIIIPFLENLIQKIKIMKLLPKKNQNYLLFISI